MSPIPENEYHCPLPDFAKLSIAKADPEPGDLVLVKDIPEAAQAPTNINPEEEDITSGKKPTQAPSSRDIYEF